VPGRSLDGIYQAMEYLPPANRHGVSSPVTAAGKHVVIIGGGDTGADCLGTAHRQGAASVTQLEILPKPSKSRPTAQPWPTYPMIYRVSSAHEEGGDRVYAVSTEEFLGDDSGAVRALRLTEVAFTDGKFVPVPGSAREIPCELALFAMGFTGAERAGLLDDLGVEFDPRGLGDRRGPQRRRRGRRVPPESGRRPPAAPGGHPLHGPPAALALPSRRLRVR
jgi:glutamate synthase (NADPH/NADH) small chain